MSRNGGQIPKRPNGRGFPRIKRSCGFVNGVWVGQINVVGGTLDPNLYRRLRDMVDDLYDRGDAETLIRIRDNGGKRGSGQGRHYEIREVYHRWKNNPKVQTIAGWRPLKELLPEWVEHAESKTSKPLRERTRKSYRNNITQLLKHAKAHGFSGDATNADLPAILLSYREHCKAHEYFMPFNQTKTMCLAYARTASTEKQDSELYRRVRRVGGLPTDRKRERRHLSVEQVDELMAKLPPREAKHVWNIVCLSSRHEEYANGQWSIEERQLLNGLTVRFALVDGTKTGYSKRPVPLLEKVEKVEYVDSTFRRHFRKAVGTAYVPRDLRSTGKAWRREAKVDEARSRQYFGWSMKSMNYRYDTSTFDDLLPHVEGDAKILSDYINRERAAAEGRRSRKQAPAIKHSEG